VDVDYVLSAWWFAFVEGLLTALFAALIVSLAVASCAWGLAKTHRWAFVRRTAAAGFAAIALGFLGWVVGYLTGMSREPAVAQVLPAVLGAVAAFAGFVAVAYDKSIGVGMMVLPFAFCLFVGSAIGAKLHMDRPQRPEQALPSLDFLKLEALKEDAIRRYRADLQLPWPPAPNPYVGRDTASAEKTDKVPPINAEEVHKR
jgi:hypothetical protein